MSEQHPNRFPILHDARRQEVGTELAGLALRVGQLVETFSGVERVPRYANGHRENDVEHSYMLTVVAPEIVNALNLDMNVDKVRRFSIAHDLLEIKVGDVATFDLTSEQFAEKERQTEQAKEELYAELPPVICADLQEYELQDTPEALFVRMVDKLLPVTVDITGDGVRIIKEDYGVTTREELQQAHAKLHQNIAEKYGSDFPDLVATHAVLCTMFEEKFAQSIADTIESEKPRNPTEIELKYLVDPDVLAQHIDLSQVKQKQLKQGYIAIGADGSETRVRSTNDTKFELTTKSPGMIAREEQTIKLTREMFNGLWAQTGGRQIIKTRHYIPLGDLMVELDVYEGHLHGLVTAEVEFDGRPSEAMIKATTFEPPVWFGKNVSEDKQYKNHSLAVEAPHAPRPFGSELL